MQKADLIFNSIHETYDSTLVRLFDFKFKGYKLSFDITKKECKLTHKINERCLTNNNFFYIDDFDGDIFYKFIASMIPHAVAMGFQITMMQVHLLNQFIIQKFLQTPYI